MQLPQNELIVTKTNIKNRIGTSNISNNMQSH